MFDLLELNIFAELGFDIRKDKEPREKVIPLIEGPLSYMSITVGVFTRCKHKMRWLISKIKR